MTISAKLFSILTTGFRDFLNFPKVHYGNWPHALVAMFFVESNQFFFNFCRWLSSDYFYNYFEI